MERGEAIGKVQQWLEALDLIEQKVDHPAPNTVARFVVPSTAKQDPGKLLINVDFPTRGPVVLIFGQTIISPEHAAKWVNGTSEMQGIFLHDYWETVARGQFLPEIHLAMKPPHGWMVMGEVFFDGLTQDRFFQCLRGVAATTQYLIFHFLKVIGMLPSPKDPTGGVPVAAGKKLAVTWDDKPKEGTT